jgi:hypothetical protein
MNFVAMGIRHWAKVILKYESFACIVHALLLSAELKKQEASAGCNKTSIPSNSPFSTTGLASRTGVMSVALRWVHAVVMMSVNNSLKKTIKVFDSIMG